MERRRANPIIIFIMGCCVVVSVCNHHHPALAQSLTAADCSSQQTCGSLKISYPFRLQSEPHCPSYSSFFDLECQGEALFLHNITVNDQPWRAKVLDIAEDSLVVDAAELSAKMEPLRDGSCTVGTGTTLQLPVFPGPFVIADDNVLGTFGCGVSVLIAGQLLPNSSAPSEPIPSDVVIGGCSVNNCSGDEKEPECGNDTCCMYRFQGLSFRIATYSVQPLSMGTTFNLSFCSISYATFFDPGFSNKSHGLKLKWALSSNQTNSITRSTNFACSNHSNSTIVYEIPGYRCSCLSGFTGDGYYLGSGCSDLDECSNASLNNCIPHKSTCYNNEGGYTCKCNSKILVGDGRMNGTGCSFSPIIKNILISFGAIILVVMLIVILANFAIYWNKKIKEKYFLLNGGMQLQDIISKSRGIQEVKSRLFTQEELKVATQNYGENTKLGMGGFGTVYKGVLKDGRLVAIKKANKEGQKGNHEFLNEMEILMQINHRNIIRLLGCCIETSTPLLVYEFVAHGNVRENLDLGDPGFMIWEQRLKVACQIAEALAYLHAAASPPILHRDVKSTNVLLDENLNAKVADFGASRLLPNGLQHVSTTVQGTIGYLDPEYFQTLQLTDKSDVYSLGVVLVELITGLKPIDNQNHEQGFVNLVYLFINHMKEARAVELIDTHLLDPSNIPSNKSYDLAKVHSSIMDVANLAWRCLALHGSDRPSMNRLVDELRHITHSLEGFDDELDSGDDGTPLLLDKSKIPKQHDVGVVVRKDGDFVIQSISASNNTSIDCLHMEMTTLPR